MSKKKAINRPTVGFIGQGYIGKNYADDFEKRGFPVIRYSAETPYISNKAKISECDIVFIAVPTPTKPNGFDHSIVEEVLKIVGKGKIAVIKSTILPGTTEMLQKKYPDIFILNSPEFLSEMTAAYDSSHPDRNIIGIPINNEKYRNLAKLIISVLPKAPFEIICSSKEAELIKYGGNCLGYLKVVYINMLYDLSQKISCDWNTVQEAMAADPRIGSAHIRPIHKTGRGAGGHCFIKDFAAFKIFYGQKVPSDDIGRWLLSDIENKNIDLMVSTNKDLDLLKGVYGKIPNKSDKRRKS